jgi:hypothetical protein
MLFIKKAIRHKKINNIHFMNLNMLSDFIRVLNSTRKHSTMNEYFTMTVIFTIIYLLQEHNLNHSKYFENQINMLNVVKVNEYYMIMHANTQYDKMHRYL